MHIEVLLTTEAIPRPYPLPVSGRCGAVAEFYGIVRGEENGEPIGALVYEAYAPMAQRVMHSLLCELAGRHPCNRAHVVHRLGEIRVGEAAIYVGVVSAHRREAFALLSAFMDRLKEEVPIWKTGVVR